MGLADVERLEVSKEVFVEGNFPILKSAEKLANWAAFDRDSRNLSFGDLARKYRLCQTPLNFALRRLGILVKGGISRMLPHRVKSVIKCKLLNK